MAFVRKLVSICFHHNILFKAKHIRGIHNNLADALSRLQVQTFRHLAPAHGPLAYRHSPASAAPELGSIVSILAKSSLQSSSIPTYRRAWTLFYQFLNTIFQSVSNSFPISPNTLALFITYMYNRNYAPSTVSSYVSALGYSHKFLGYSDPTKAFFIIQVLKGYNKLGYRLDARLPITLPVLQKLIESSATLSISEFQFSQFRAMCTTAFFAFLRIGEMAYNSAKDASNLILQAHHVSKLVYSSKYVVALKITFGNFKHSYNQRPFTIFLHRQNSFCPVQFLLV